MGTGVQKHTADVDDFHFRSAKNAARGNVSGAVERKTVRLNPLTRDPGHLVRRWTRAFCFQRPCNLT